MLDLQNATLHLYVPNSTVHVVKEVTGAFQHNFDTSMHGTLLLCWHTTQYW